MQPITVDVFVSGSITSFVLVGYYLSVWVLALLLPRFTKNVFEQLVAMCGIYFICFALSLFLLPREIFTHPYGYHIAVITPLIMWVTYFVGMFAPGFASVKKYLQVIAIALGFSILATLGYAGIESAGYGGEFLVGIAAFLAFYGAAIIIYQLVRESPKKLSLTG